MRIEQLIQKAIENGYKLIHIAGIYSHQTFIIKDKGTQLEYQFTLTSLHGSWECKQLVNDNWIATDRSRCVEEILLDKKRNDAGDSNI